MAVSQIDNNGVNLGQLGNRNLIINGAMQVAQRGTSFTSAGTQYTLDRFRTEQGGIDNALINATQDSDAPSGFAKSLKVTVATAETAVADDEYMGLVHIIEAQDLQQLDYNTAAAKSVTLSFWVKASVTGVYAVANYVDDGIRIIGATYTINSANTWEYKTITYAGDTAGLLDDNNGPGFYLYWYFAAGPDRKSSSNTSWGAYAGTKLAYGQEVQLIETVNATWQITGVQLEVGDTATPFEHRSYGDELARCQRYYEQKDYLNTGFVSIGYSSSGAAPACMLEYSEKRAAPTITLPNAGKTTGEISFLTGVGGYATTVGSHSIQTATIFNARIQGASYSGLTSAQPSPLFFTGAASIKIDSEL